MRKPFTPDTARAWVDVDLDSLVRNARSYAARVGVPLLPMVKADGYGLGAVAISRALAETEPWGYGVATIDEARELYVNGIVRPIVIFSPLAPPMIEYVNAIAARPVIGDLQALRAWLQYGNGPFHVEIDTGMSRGGFRWDDDALFDEARKMLVDAPEWEGIFTHLHSAERDPTSIDSQWARLHAVIERIGRRPAFVHATNSAAGAAGESHRGDFARPGIHLYGGQVAGFDTIRVAALRARVAAVRRMNAGDPVSYDATWHAPMATTIATLSIGYADGVSRHLSNCGVVELLGHRLPIVGRITMDHVMIDAGDLPVEVNDVATLWGGLVTLDEQAALAGTISYELLTALGSRLPRRYLPRE